MAWTRWRTKILRCRGHETKQGPWQRTDDDTTTMTTTTRACRGNQLEWALEHNGLGLKYAALLSMVAGNKGAPARFESAHLLLMYGAHESPRSVRQWTPT